MTEPLQMIQNVAVPLGFNQPKRDRITPLSVSLHWIPAAGSCDLILFYVLLTVHLKKFCMSISVTTSEFNFCNYIHNYTVEAISTP